MNTKQRESAAKYLYDISKGILLAGLVALFTDKVSPVGFALHGVIATYLFVVAQWFEEDGNERI